MALAHIGDHDPDWVPRDSFGVRLAMLRAHLGGLNVKKAAQWCGINDQSWRNWEAGGSTPRDYETITAKIAAATGCDLQWLRAGGELRSRCSSSNGQVERHLWAVPDPDDLDEGSQESLF